MSAAPSPARVPIPPDDPEPIPELAPVPFGQLDIAPIKSEPIPGPNYVPFGLPDIAPLFHIRYLDLLIFLLQSHSFLHPHPLMLLPYLLLSLMSTVLIYRLVSSRTSLHPIRGRYFGPAPRYDPFASAVFPPIPPITSFTPFSSTPLEEPFRWFPPYTMPISDPYHPSHFVGYTRDELLLSLQLKFEILSRRVMELELTPPCPPPCPCQCTFLPPHTSPSASFIPPPAVTVPPHSSTSHFAHPPATL
ncbi:hypothetical protein HanPI659440_Chr04g0160661 [Helianthus annuus]|nr:hypothetical protein HanPI659440_Chr04g0160661 [Helianthus annuus]